MNVFTGQNLDSVPLGFTDTAGTTCLHVPSIGLIVAGDAAHNGVHLHLSESPDQQKRQEWIAALDKMESLKPRAVIAGHKRVGKSKRPVVLTVKGKAAAIVQDAEAYQRLLDIAARADSEEGIRQGLDDVAHGRTRPAKEVFDDIRRKHGISH
jgi:glyoxylase-like metal-dependent hydrolase (beta-lactamase superfamily II)